MVVLLSGSLRKKSAGFQTVPTPWRRHYTMHQARFHEPEGFVMCIRCTDLIATDSVDEDGIARCANGHSFDVAAVIEEAAKYSGHARPPRSGLTRTQMGDLGEWIIWKYARDLGAHGRIIGDDSHFESRPYNDSLDFLTDAHGGVEVKTVDIEGTLAFQYGKPQYRLDKDAALKEHHCFFALMLLVVIDFRELKASIYARRRDRFVNWKIAGRDEPFAVVDFELPPWAEAVVGGADRADELLGKKPVAVSDDDFWFQNTEPEPIAA